MTWSTADMAEKTEGRRIARWSKSTSIRSLFGWFVKGWILGSSGEGYGL